MIAIAVIALAAFTLGLVIGRWSYRRSLAKALERLAPRPPSAALDHDAIRHLVTQYRFPSGEGPSARTPP